MIITTEHIYVANKNVELMCGFYGDSHPKCKEAIQKSKQVREGFILQFYKKTNDKDKKDGGDHD